MFSFTGLVRLTLLGVVVLGIPAVLLGRYAPKAPGDPRIGHRSHTHPRYRWMGRWGASREPHQPCLLDTETGATLKPSVPDLEEVVFQGCSPWRDGQGQFHLVGLDCSPTPALVRFTLPAGRLLDRVAIDPLPVASPWWSPEAIDRVLYIAGDGQLYHYGFPEADESRAPAQAKPLRWAIEPPGDGTLYIQDLCWPNESLLRGHLLATLNLWDHDSRAYRDPQLWWLKLSLDGTAIVAAGRLLRPGGDDAPPRRIRQRLPSVGSASDGTPLLAYLTRTPEQTARDLWVVPITVDAASGTPRVSTAGVRKLAEGCEAMAPAFSADGRWVYAVRRNAGSDIRLERFAVAVTPAR